MLILYTKYTILTINEIQYLCVFENIFVGQSQNAIECDVILQSNVLITNLPVKALMNAFKRN